MPPSPSSSFLLFPPSHPRTHKRMVNIIALSPAGVVELTSVVAYTDIKVVVVVVVGYLSRPRTIEKKREIEREREREHRLTVAAQNWKKKRRNTQMEKSSST